MAEPLHAYLLLDSSASMSGAPLEALKQGVNLLCGTFISRSKRPVLVAVISYESTVRSTTELTDVNGFKVPELDAAGSSSLGKALRRLLEVMPTYSPTLVYIFTDGEPTDDWEASIGAVKAGVQKIVAIGCGPTADLAVLTSQVDSAFGMRELTPDLLFETFRALQ